MADQPEVILKQMEDTKASLAEKLEALENQVSHSVENTTEAVAETVEAVKETVENVTESVKETVHTVSDAFNVKQHVERYPWASLGGAVAVGCLAGYYLGGRSKRRRARNADAGAETPSRASGTAPAAFGSTTWREPEQSSSPYQASTQAPSEHKEEGKKSWFWEELGRLKGLGLGVLMGAVRDLASRSLPESISHRVAEEVDHLTTNLGGEPIRGSVLSEEK